MKKKRLARYGSYVHKLMTKQLTVDSIKKKLESLHNKEFIMRIPIGGKKNG